MRRDFPGNPVVKTSVLPVQRARVQRLVGELRSHKVCGVTPSKKSNILDEENRALKIQSDHFSCPPPLKMRKRTKDIDQHRLDI